MKTVMVALGLSLAAVTGCAMGTVDPRLPPPDDTGYLPGPDAGLGGWYSRRWRRYTAPLGSAAVRRRIRAPGDGERPSSERTAWDGRESATSSGEPMMT